MSTRLLFLAIVRALAFDLFARRRQLRAALRLALLVACVPAPSAWARLGGMSNALDSESAALAVSTHRIEHHALYDVHRLQRDDGQIRQFSDREGRIFAVAWQTHRPVNLADLLGPPWAVSAARQPATQLGRTLAGRHSASLVTGDRVVHVLKMSHLYMGTAQLSKMIPQGVDPKELR